MHFSHFLCSQTGNKFKQKQSACCRGPRVTKFKKRHFVIPLLVQCLGSMKLDILLNLSLANMLITACLLCGPLIFFKKKKQVSIFKLKLKCLNGQCLQKLFVSIIMSLTLYFHLYPIKSILFLNF